jgi:hypothetical protein
MVIGQWWAEAHPTALKQYFAQVLNLLIAPHGVLEPVQVRC